MLEHFLDKVQFESYEDFMANFKINVPERFNFGYDVVDRWAEKEPDKKALLWTNDQGKVIQFTFADIKRESDKTAAFFASQGIGSGDGYRYPHDFPGHWVRQEYMPPEVRGKKYYRPTEMGHEATILKNQQAREGRK